jgi:hypothetical protein
MTAALDFRWEMLLGEDSPYGAYDLEAFDSEAFETSSDWTDVSRDVRSDPAPAWSRGMHGGTPADRVAGVGVLNFSMNNFPHNAPRLLGYYSPGHENQRDGFALGIGCRLRAIAGDLNAVLFFGTLEAVLVEPGEHRSRHVEIVVVDWMEEAATNQVENVETLVDVRSDEAFTAIIESLPRQPIAVQTDVGMDTYAYAVDTARQEAATAQSEFQKLAMSELGYIFVKADGTTVFEGRRKRGAESSINVYTFDALTDVSVKRSRGDLINKVKVITHPRRVDAAPVILYRLVQPVQIASGQVTRLFGGYSDPEQRGRRTGGFDFIVPLVAGVDYIANSAGDGSGVDMTSAISVAVSTTGNGVSFQITNIGSSAAWVTTLQIRGRGIYDFEHAVMEAEDETSILRYGRRTRSVDMPYQSDALVGYSAAQYLLSLYADAISSAETVTFLPTTRELIEQAFIRDISDRIGILESVTGLTDDVEGTTATRGWFINGVRGEILSGRYLRMTYVLTPADRNTYWNLGVIGSSELSLTTRLGYGIFQGHTDVAHLDTHSDLAHVDSAHSDTHGDVAHADGAHADSSHSDAHVDNPHVDTAHSDTHGDSSHSDTAHVDSHSDGAHSDAHTDTPHVDEHVDEYQDIATPHGDSHSDQEHFDSHVDVAHNDSHNDSAHVDVAHGDSHSDNAHVDIDHQDLHDDAGHQDAAHADVTHTDTHTDVLHVDTAHEDSHGDIGHGDTFG